jgi:hypothetical protein
MSVSLESRPLCFVLMPFGKKKDPGGGPDIDFDSVYELGIRPAIDAAGLESIRADEERAGGIIHKPMFERLLLCDFAIADLTTGNANVLYELGVRHATRPSTTLMIFAQQSLPFDIGLLRALPYKLDEGNRFGPSAAAALSTTLARRLKDLRAEAGKEGPITDSPVFQLLPELQPSEIAHLKTDVFRNRVRYASEKKRELQMARNDGNVDSIVAVEGSLGPLDSVETGVLVDLFLSYRAVQAWDRMVDLFERLPPPLKRTVMIREQLAFALNRRGDWKQAVSVLEDVIREHGPSSENSGLLGRVYKDQWVKALSTNPSLAAGYLDRAINTYVRGFESDWRDAYPGINAVTLLDIKGDGPALQRKEELLPVVRFAVKQRLRASRPDYWDYATLLELAILANDEAEAGTALSEALVAVREPWEGATTANNLKLIRTARRERGIQQPRLDDIIAALETVA